MTKRREPLTRVFVPSTPWPIFICAIDPSNESSGWAMFISGMLFDHGVAVTWFDRAQVANRAAKHAKDAGLPLLFVLEDWGGSVRSTLTAFGMGAARGKWLQVIGETHYREDHVSYIHLSTWRSRAGVGRCADSDAYKARAVEMVRRKFSVSVEHDEAEAILIGDVASQSPESMDMVETIARARKKAA